MNFNGREELATRVPLTLMEPNHMMYSIEASLVPCSSRLLILTLNRRLHSSIFDRPGSLDS